MLTMKSLSAALAVLTVSGGVAAAQSATAELKMRSGPGTGYQVISVIPAGAPVAVTGCNGRWCQVAYAGRSGFAPGGYLGGSPGAVATMPSAPAAAYAYGAAPGGYTDIGYASGLGWDSNAQAYRPQAYRPQAYRHGYRGWSGGHNDW